MDIGIEQLQFENAISDDVAIGVDPSAQVTPGQPLRSAATASASATVSLRVPDDPTGAEYDADGVPLVGRRRGARAAAAAAALRGDRTRGSRYRVNVTAGGEVDVDVDVDGVAEPGSPDKYYSYEALMSSAR